MVLSAEAMGLLMRGRLGAETNRFSLREEASGGTKPSHYKRCGSESC